MLDGEPDESAEFIELVNVSDDPLALAGLVLSGRRGEGQSRRVSFEGGCIGPGTAVALYAQQADWRWSEPALEPVTAVLNAFGFANDGPFEFRLEDPAGRLLSLAEGLADDAEPGVSLNRQPDLVGETFVAHTRLAPDADASPGTCPNQGRYVERCLDGVEVVGGQEAGPPEGPDGSARPCRRPMPGELIINEMMIDGDPDADQEFVELVNTTDVALDLGGIQLESNSGRRLQRRLIFTQGCIVAHGAVAMFPNYADWVWTPAPLGRPSPDISRFSFPNQADFAFVLLGADGTQLDTATGMAQLIEEGVSVNRSPDIVGQAFVRHSDLADRPMSPGRCPNGGTYLAQCEDPVAVRDGGPAPGPADAGVDAEPPLPCDPPSPGQLRISEVMVDGEVPRTEGDEFVELVNTAPVSVRLTGLTVALRGEGEEMPTTQVVFGPGCAPPGGMVALSRDDEMQVWEPSFVPQPGFSSYRIRLSNAGNYTVQLQDVEGTVLDAFEVVGRPIEPGVSLCRPPDSLDGAPVLHTDISPLRRSPARCPNGATWAENPGCRSTDVADGAAPDTPDAGL